MFIIFLIYNAIKFSISRFLIDITMVCFSINIPAFFFSITNYDQDKHLLKNVPQKIISGSDKRFH